MTPLPSRLALECMDSESTRAAQNTIDPDRFPADDQRSVGGRDRHDDIFHLFFVLGWLHGRGPLEGEEGCGEYPFTAKTALFLVPARYTRAKLGVHFPPTKDYTWLSWFPGKGKGQGLGRAAWALAATYTGNAPGRERERFGRGWGFFFSWKPVVSGRLPWTRASVCSDRNHGCVVGGTSGTYRTTTKYSNQDFFSCAGQCEMQMKSSRHLATLA